jgi:predicted metal-dependent phosphotriesterase family hydrolase
MSGTRKIMRQVVEEIKQNIIDAIVEAMRRSGATEEEINQFIEENKEKENQKNNKDDKDNK